MNASTNVPSTTTLVDDLFRREAGRIVAGIVRRIGIARLDVAEDAMQDAMQQALGRWPMHGTPDDPAAWLRRVAQNRALELLRTGTRRERLAEADMADRLDVNAAVEVVTNDDGLGDDDLRLLFACAHPSLSADVAVTLMLKSVGGFGVREIARALLAEPETIAQRLVRARRALATAAEPLAIPASADAAAPRRALVANALYLMFTEGHTASESADVVRQELCVEALRLAQRLATHDILGGPDLHALVALFALQASRLDARADEAGVPMLIVEQDRARWNQQLVALGMHHLERAMDATELTRWHVEAEIASHHALAPAGGTPDWPAIVSAYDRLARIAPSPVVEVNRAIARCFADGPHVAAAALDALDGSPRLRDYPWYHAARADMARRMGDLTQALAHYDAALAVTTSQPQRTWLVRRRATCRVDS